MIVIRWHTPSSVAPSKPWGCSTVRMLSVRVPVLSEQRMSIPANSSTAVNLLTIACFFANCPAPIALYKFLLAAILYIFIIFNIHCYWKNSRHSNWNTANQKNQNIIQSSALAFLHARAWLLANSKLHDELNHGPNNNEEDAKERDLFENTLQVAVGFNLGHKIGGSTEKSVDSSTRNNYQEN